VENGTWYLVVGIWYLSSVKRQAIETGEESSG